MIKESEYLRLHIETVHSIPVEDLSNSLNAYGHQYQQFAVDQGFAPKAGDARLLVSSVSRGSIDIAFIPELVAVGMTLLPLVEQGTLVVKFADQLISLIRQFQGHSVDDTGRNITVADCDDVANIVSPVADNGGTQHITVINGGVTVNQITVTQEQAHKIRKVARATKEALSVPLLEIRKAVSLTWQQLAKDAPKTQGKRSPDQGLIEEIDKSAHAVLFTEETAHLKAELIADGENPYRMVYFVDVEVSRISDRVVSYRVCGFHGKEELAA
tara:strand:- start:5170 stop:5982 length:813 start_codon:yes stop_codon:yes gene_type:complete